MTIQHVPWRFTSPETGDETDIEEYLDVLFMKLHHQGGISAETFPEIIEQALLPLWERSQQDPT